MFPGLSSLGMGCGSHVTILPLKPKLSWFSVPFYSSGTSVPCHISAQILLEPSGAHHRARRQALFAGGALPSLCSAALQSPQAGGSCASDPAPTDGSRPEESRRALQHWGCALWSSKTTEAVSHLRAKTSEGGLGAGLQRPGIHTRFRWIPICHQELNVNGISPDDINVRVTVT